MLLPNALQDIATSRINELAQLQPESLALWQGDARGKLERTLGLSDFIGQALQSQPTLLSWLFQHLVFRARAPRYREDLEPLLASQPNELSVMKALRHFRNREMLWLAWHDFNHSISLDDSLYHLSALAEGIIVEAYAWLYEVCCREMGTPCDEEGRPQPMLILGMGKLGGEELNFSSDIDLIFTYPENGQTQGLKRSISNSQFFARLGQRLIKVLDQQTMEGFCYRVDMRLRPFGESGPLVMSFAALEDYYQEQGRDWERYAMVKARVLGKEQVSCYQSLRKMLRPFVFRRYIDFSAIQSLRRMKSLVQSEVRRRGLTKNIKLGAGGIRELEFIVQSFQLIRGGREPLLRKRGFFVTLKAICDLGLITKKDAQILEVAYRYLRRIENRLQAIADKQTQTLPECERDQSRLFIAMKESSWESMLENIQNQMSAVRVIFDDLVGNEEEKEHLTTQIPSEYAEIWDAARDKDLVRQILEELNSAQCIEKAEILFHFKEEIAKRSLGSRGREVLHRLMPFILLETLSLKEGLGAFERVLVLLAAIATRTTYLELFDEHHSAITQLVRLCSASPMVASQLTKYPVLLDELLDRYHLYHPTPFDQYRTGLFEFLARTPQEDMEQQMEMIRQYKQGELLRIAAADIAGVLPVMKVSDHLTFLAEAIVCAVVEQAWHQMVMKFGQPTHLKGDDGRGFAVIGYGKLGGIELAYGSDLDVVFLHDCPLDSVTDGKTAIDGRQFYLKLAQRIVHLFSTKTSSGVLYEIDTRLRPSGVSGMLVTTLDSFQEYQQTQAWTWEHQALVRARLVYGESAIASAFSSLREEVLTQKRDRAALRKDVQEMRQKMKNHQAAKKRASKNAPLFHIKHDAGGITDIEFLTQFLLLANAHEMPDLTRWSDNVRLLDALATAGILDPVQALSLIDAYTRMRNEIHRLNLLDAPLSVCDTSFLLERQAVEKAWKQSFFIED